MAETMQFDLVSPERPVASYQARAVRIPAAEGQLTAMPGHTPLIVSICPGIVQVEGENGEEEYVVTGGFAQIIGDKISVLAEESLHRSDITQEIFDRMIEEANQRYKKAQDNWENEPGMVDDAAKLLSDMVAMGENVGLSARQSAL